MSAAFVAEAEQQSLPSSMSSSYQSDEEMAYTSSSSTSSHKQQAAQPQPQPRYRVDGKTSSGDDDGDSSSGGNVVDRQPAVLRQREGAHGGGDHYGSNGVATISKMRPYTTGHATRAGNNNNNNNISNSSISNNNVSGGSGNVAVNASSPGSGAATTTTAAAAAAAAQLGEQSNSGGGSGKHDGGATPRRQVNLSSSSPSRTLLRPTLQPNSNAAAATTTTTGTRHVDVGSMADVVQRAKAFVRSDTAPSTASHVDPQRGNNDTRGYAAGRVAPRLATTTTATAAARTSSPSRTNTTAAAAAASSSSSSSSASAAASALGSVMATTTQLPSNSNASVGRVLAAPAWVDAMALSHLLCEHCHHVVCDPVQCQPSAQLLCRRCAAYVQAADAAHVTIHELPVSLVRAIYELLDRARLLRGDWTPTRHRTTTTAATTAAALEPAAAAAAEGEPAATTTAAKQQTASDAEEQLARRRAAPAGHGGGGDKPSSNAHHHQHGNSRAAADAGGGAGALAPRERTSAGTATTAVTTTAASAAATTTTAAATPAPMRMLELLTEAEKSERAQVALLQQRGFAELERLARRSRANASGPTSRQLKIEADRLYEATQYNKALEYYTRAIALQRDDQQAQLPALYGNRSAANFMAHRYAECVADCLAVVQLDPSNLKMHSRAARAAATMGDLAQAVAILEKAMTSSSGGGGGSGSAAPSTQGGSGNGKHVNLATELAKYKQGAELLNKATQQFGTAEGDVHLRMLIAQFADTVPFRVRYAESLMRQRQHLRAYDVLDAVAQASRPPSVTRVMAECLYLSGFEHFERARRLLTDDAAAARDAGCAQLLQMLERVDEGKQSGNNNFAQKRFSAAVENYTTAIAHAAGNDQILRILYCNRAAANKEIGRYREGIEDCTRALAIDPDFFKAYARRARCHQHLGDHYAAVQDFKKALQYESADSELARELRSAEYHLAKEAEREKDYYYQLGLTRVASEREVKVRYRELSLRWHPDKCVNLPDADKARAEHKFKVISEAYAVLSDVVKRREYDRKYDLERYTRGGFMPGAASAAAGMGGGAATGAYASGGNEAYRSGVHGRHRSGPGGSW